MEIKEPDMLLLISDEKKRQEFLNNFNNFNNEKLEIKDFIKQFNKLQKDKNEKPIKNKKLLKHLYSMYLLKLHEKYPMFISYWKDEPGAKAYEYTKSINKAYTKTKEERDLMLDVTEKEAKRNKELEKRLGEIKNTIPEFIEYYNINKTDDVKTEKLFDDFKEKYDCIKNHTWNKYYKNFSAYGFKLKK